MVRHEVIHKRLRKLDEYLTILHQLQQYSLEEFLDSPERYGSAERFLQLAIESVTDMGNHIIADLGLGAVDWYSDIPRLLYEAEYIDVEMRERWIQMIGFRNVLVHDYLDINRNLVYSVLQDHLVDFESLRQVFVQFL